MTPMARRSAPTPAYRLQVAWRIAAAVFASFALTSAFGALLAAALMRSGALPRPSAVQAATLLAFCVWCGAVMWAFQSRSAARVWLNQGVPALLMGILAWWLLRGASA